jgi:hypothetical protein
MINICNPMWLCLERGICDKATIDRQSRTKMAPYVSKVAGSPLCSTFVSHRDV